MCTCSRKPIGLRVAYDVFLATVRDEVARDSDADAVSGSGVAMDAFAECERLVDSNLLFHGIDTQRLR